MIDLTTMKLTTLRACIKQTDKMISGIYAAKNHPLMGTLKTAEEWAERIAVRTAENDAYRAELARRGKTVVDHKFNRMARSIRRSK